MSELEQPRLKSDEWFQIGAKRGNHKYSETEMREALCRYRYIIIILSFCYFNRLISATVVLKPLLFSFPDLPAKFAAGLNDSARCGALHLANPVDACSSLASNNTAQNVRFVLIERGECSFEDKIRNAQNAGFLAAIVYDNRDMRNLIYMMMNPEGMNVSAVFVSKMAGEILRDHARGKEGECCIYLTHFGVETLWNVVAISFFSLFVMISFLMMAFVMPRHWIYSLRIRKCVDLRMLESLPRFKFRSARLNLRHSGETCAICIEDYKDGEILKVLPCQHEYHSSCVDSWLTNWGTFCPVCKFDMKAKSVFSEAFRLSGLSI
ncbi:receptor homology region, transmembrane domain- and RING domain-containing protein 1 [Euphorbia lathyris]|uniref:receptor homology region, transmembrane domain- and RING domain-containing protein 1 n=1 Tax=Euphorbia lathyris TaxID=212925 RepID=UPI00331393A8